MIGVTIGIGEKYNFYARKAAEAFERHTKLQTLVLDESALKSVSGHRIFDDAYSIKHRSCILKFFIPYFIGREDFVYFDSDYMCVADWSPEEQSSGLFCAVRDRTKYLMEAKKTLCVPHIQYFNSGMMIVPSNVSFKIMNRCIEDYDKILNHFFEQCSLNHAIQSLDIEMRYLDRRFNCMNYSGEFEKYDIRAIHCSSNYPYFEKEERRLVTSERFVNTSKMRQFSLYHPEFLADGTTLDGNCWFADNENGVQLFDYLGNKLSVN